MLYWLDLFGVFVFALSGALAADRRGMDLFGFTVIALFTAIGGGTLRDIVLDVPVFWVTDATYLGVILMAAIVTWFADAIIDRAERWLVWADALGLSVFCVAGAAKAWAVTGSAPIAIAMGVVSAVFGGIVRDVVCNEIPLVLRQDIYATAAFAGAATWAGLVWSGALTGAAALWVGAAVCFAVRASAIVFRWSLPTRGGPAD